MRVIVLIGLVFAAAPAAAEEEPRPFSVALTVSASIGWVDMGQFSSASESYFGQLESQVVGFERRGSATSHVGLGFSVRSQLRLPRHMTIEAGLEVIRHRRTTPIAIGSTDGEIGFVNTSIALPLALGIHVPISRRLAWFAAAGPVLITNSRSQWEYSLGQISSFDGKIGGGFEASAGAELAALWRIRFTATMRYRFAKSGELRPDGPELPPLQPVTELGWKGVGAELGARVVF